MSSGELSILLNQVTNKLKIDFLNHALAEATHMDNADNVAQLILAGAESIDECLSIAAQEKKPYARAMLLLIKAAQTDDQSIVQKVFGEPAPNLRNKEYFADSELFRNVQSAILRGDVISVGVPIAIAGKYGNARVKEELLLRTKVDQEVGCIDWDGLQLLSLETGWLRKIAWVEDLNLSRNGFQTLPPEMGTYLKQVIYALMCA